MKKKIMIECILINSIKDQFVPEEKYFNDWINAINYNGKGEITIKITTAEEMRKFNKLYKNTDKVSDTLAFPSENLICEEKIILGDIAMCAKKINEESIMYNKREIERWAHLTIHSMLHILGYNHDSDSKRKEMENIEINILKEFNIFNPYEI